MREDIKNDKNNIIGWIDDVSDRVNAYTHSNGYCGYYYKSSNITYDKAGKIYCYGNGAQCLVRDYYRGILR